MGAVVHISGPSTRPLLCATAAACATNNSTGGVKLFLKKAFKSLDTFSQCKNSDDVMHEGIVLIGTKLNVDMRSLKNEKSLWKIAVRTMERNSVSLKSAC